MAARRRCRRMLCCTSRLRFMIRRRLPSPIHYQNHQSQGLRSRRRADISLVLRSPTRRSLVHLWRMKPSRSCQNYSNRFEFDLHGWSGIRQSNACYSREERSKVGTKGRGDKLRMYQRTSRLSQRGEDREAAGVTPHLSDLTLHFAAKTASPERDTQKHMTHACNAPT